MSIMNYPPNIINMQDIMELVRVLRQNGDEVLSASSRLSLSTKLLHNLNEAFLLIVVDSEELDCSFQVCNSSKINIFHDVKFLHDFVQKTIGLKLTQHPLDPEVSIDISKFRHLKNLELKKISIESVKGLQSVRGQLESIICTGKEGVNTINQLLAACGGDVGVGFVWTSLRHLALPHNGLKSLDKSLELAPWLQTLDLSHNMITSAMEISHLLNLKHVNLSYNKLESVPVFNKLVIHSLQVLVLKNNYIENINGLECLECLTELDLSYNCLTEHSVLWPLQKMSALLWLSLERNPLSYHEKHRLQSLKYLHPNLSDSKFVIDQLPLTPSEKLLVAQNRASMIHADPFRILTNSMSTCTDMSDSISSNEAISLPEKSEKQMSKNKRKPYVKEAVIDEIEQEKNDQKLLDVVASFHLETSQDHLETKRRIIALREKYGEDNWLSNQAGTFVQNIMGLHSASQMSSSPISGIQNFVDIDTLHASLMYITDTTDTTDKHSLSETESQKILEHIEDNIEDKEYDKATEDEGISLNQHLEIVTTDPITNLILYDPDEETGDLYLVQKKKDNGEMEDVFLVINPEDIKERSINNGEVKYSWSTNSVLSCVLGRTDPPTVDIIFDTTRKDRENRRYFMELDDAKKIVMTISKQMDMRPILLKIFKCMQCSTQFSQDADYTILNITSLSDSSTKQLKCPTCTSSLVIEIEDSSNVDNQSLKDLVKTNLQHSESFSSIGTVTSLEESRESTPSTNVLTKKYESDIEILSNPSQSSIEVLDEMLKTNSTPSRKRSMEDECTVIDSSTIPNATSMMAGLTESSSSGSLTDSVCTAYENRASKSSSIDTKSHCTDSEKEMSSTPVGNLTSMLGGLLQSIKIGNSKTVKSEETPSFLGSNVQYSYTDFSSVDHRVKLHIVLNVFEHENEKLVLLLRADILMNYLQEPFPGCLVLSTSKVYVLRIDGIEGEDPQRWLHKEISWTMDRLRSFVPLPFKQGVLIELQQPSRNNEKHSSIMLLCILQDYQRTSNFLFYITDLRLPPSCEVEFTVPEHCSTLVHNLLKTTTSYQVGDAVRLLAMFSAAVLKHKNITINLKSSGLIVTSSGLVILQDNIMWLVPDSNRLPILAREQPMNNLIAIEQHETSLILKFLNEVEGHEESWSLKFVSSDAATAVISSIQPPWEELFSIPLQKIICTVQETAEKV